MRIASQFLHSSNGAVALVTALIMPALIGFAALGIDYGSFLTEQRRLQGIVDLAALSAAGTVGEEETTARRVMTDNQQGSATLEVTLGALSTDAYGFQTFTPGSGGGAVLVRGSRPTPLFFSGLFLSEEPVVQAHAIAVANPVVSMSVGSSLMGVSGGIPAALTKTLLGTEVDLSLLNYEGLARARIGSSGLIDSLAGILGRTSGTVGELLDEEVSVNVLLQAVAQQLQNEAMPVEASRVRLLAQKLARTSATVSLGRLLAVPGDVRDLTLGEPSSYLTADVGALGLVSASLMPRAGGSALSAGLAVPGLLSTNLDLLIGDPMQSTPPSALGDPDLRVDTSQIRGRFNLTAGSLLSALGANANLPIELAVAPSTARVVSVTCNADPAKRSVVVEAQPGALRLEIGRQRGALQDVGLAPSNSSATIVDAKLASVTAHALATVQATRPTRVVFSGSDISNGKIRTVGSTQMVGKLVDDLFSTLDVNVRVLGLGLPLGGVLDAAGVKTALKTLTPAVDTLLDGLLETLGVKIGAVDIRVDDLVCGAPKIAA